ncbi:MAG TPA: hypothetical protein VFB27_14380 [Opitutaceae bacterium]|nr:hypothetical protein [Opitutaceae bacterium]
MQRKLQPEILDTLPPDHPDALHSRRNIRQLNALMGNFRWFAATLPGLLRPGERALELGAGDGALGLALARRGLPVDGLDFWPRPVDWPREAAWHRTDLRSFTGYGGYAVVFGNLIFHHFSAAELAVLGGALSSTAQVIVACEPSRRRRFQFLLRGAGPLLHANYVTRHDAHVSIAAGFIGDELARALGLDEKAWTWRCAGTAFGSNRMIARRR